MYISYVREVYMGSTVYLYLALGKNAQKACEDVNGSVPECKCLYEDGLATLRCESFENLVNAILLLIEDGVDPRTPAAWLCGPSGELARVYALPPDACPEERLERIVLYCSRYETCIDTYFKLRELGLDARFMRVKRLHSKCSALYVKFNERRPSMRDVAGLIAHNAALSAVMVYPKKLPPLAIPRGSSIWINGCSKSKVQL